MLRFFAKFQRSRNLVLIAFCAVLLIGLVVFYIPSTPLDPTGQFGGSSEEDDTVIAKVGSQEITVKELRGRLQQLGSSLGGRSGNSIPLQTLKQLGMDKQALDQLIASRLMIDQASTLNLTGTDREVNDFVKSQFTDENGKFIGAEEYKRRLRLQGVNIAEFEQDRRNDFAAGKVRDFLTSAEQVSDKDVEEKYKKDNTKVEVVYATVELDKIRQKYKPSEEDLKAHYEANKNEFKAAAPTRKVDYLFISTDDAAKIVPVSEEELRQEYENRKQYEYRASIIKLNVLTDDDDPTVKAKIDELNLKVRGSQNAKPEDFAAVARGNSQDPSKDKGGDIGWIKKEPNKKNDWKQRLYGSTFKVGDIDGPFRDGRSWYIMKVTEQRQVPFDQMRDTLKATLSNNKAFTRASQLADLAYEKATEFKDLRKAAEEIAKVLKVSPESLLKSTPYFKNGDSFELGKGSGRSNVPAFEEAVSTLKKGEIGDKVSIPGGQAIPQIVDIIENGQQLTFDQARNQVEDKIRAVKEPTLALSKAQEIVNQAQNAEDFQRLAKAEGLDVKTDTNFNNYAFPGMASGGAGAQASTQARTAVIGLKDGEVSKTPIKAGASYLIFAATKRTEADLSKLPSQRESIRQGISSERRQATYEAYVKSARKLYEQQGKIKIYQDRIDKFFASVATEQ